jgi:hypothetical protein
LILAAGMRFLYFAKSLRNEMCKESAQIMNGSSFTYLPRTAKHQWLAMSFVTQFLQIVVYLSIKIIHVSYSVKIWGKDNSISVKILPEQ